MEEMEVVIIDSVQPGNHDHLDRKEEDWIHRLRTVDNMGQGGLNIRDNLKRNNRGKCKCNVCKKIKKIILWGVRSDPACLSGGCFNMEIVIMFTYWFRN